MTISETYQQDLLSQIAEGISVKKTEEKLLKWGVKYLSHYFTHSFNRQHISAADILEGMRESRGQHWVVKGPRGSAKSVIVVLLGTLYDICEETEDYIQIYSDSYQQAEQHLDGIKHELETNWMIAKDYPMAAGEGPTWRTTTLVCRNGIRVDALSMSQKMRGRRKGAKRPSKIILDDPQNDQHVFSQIQRERSNNTYSKGIEPSGTTKTNIIVVGTSLHRECLVEALAKRPGWQSLTFKALMEYPSNMDLWDRWKDILCRPDDDTREAKARKFFLDNKEAMEAGADVLWPEWESLYDLMLMWAGDRVAFEYEKQNHPYDPTALEFPPDYFNYEDFWFDEWPEKMQVRIMSCDPSKGRDSKKGDYSAICLLGLGLDKRLYVDFDMARRPADTICADLLTNYVQFKPETIVLEVNSGQDLLIPMLDTHADEMGIDTYDLTEIENTAPKPVRIRRLGKYHSRRMVRYRNNPDTRLAVEQMMDYTGSSTDGHDDGPDAEEMAIRVMNDLLGGTDSVLDQQTEFGEII